MGTVPKAGCGSGWRGRAVDARAGVGAEEGGDGLAQLADDGVIGQRGIAEAGGDGAVVPLDGGAAAVKTLPELVVVPIVLQRHRGQVVELVGGGDELDVARGLAQG